MSVPEIGRVSFDTDEFRYDLNLAWNDKDLMEGNISFGISAARTSLENPEVFDKVAVSLSVEQDDSGVMVLVGRFDGYEGNVSVEGIDNLEDLNGELFRIKLDDLYDEIPVLDAIPGFLFGGDHIAGCLIKAGISASVSQLINCKNMSANQDAGWQKRLRLIGRCLRQSIPGMCAKMSFRAARCIVTGF